MRIPNEFRQKYEHRRISSAIENIPQPLQGNGPSISLSRFRLKPISVQKL